MRQEGFFSKSQLDKMKGMKFDRDIVAPDCKKCGLYDDAINPKMQYTGEGKKNVLIIAEQPGREEDRLNKQLVGDTGQFYRNALSARGLDLDRDFYKINSVNCFSPNKPTRTQLSCCRPLIDETIKKLKPHFVWLLGEYAITSQYMGRFEDLSAGRWRGLSFPDRDLNAWIIGQYHPSWAMRNQWDNKAQIIFNQDLDFAIDQLRLGEVAIEKAKYYYEENHVEIITDFDRVCEILEDIYETATGVSFDYETNCLKPYINGAKVLSVALSPNTDISYAFPLTYRDFWTPLQLRAIKRRLKMVLEEPYIKLRAHNLKFEDQWSKYALDISPRGWERCTMVTAHVIDDRAKFTGLKFQVYKEFGTPDYSRHIRPYIKGFPFNKMEELDIEDLLMYNGIDALVEERLAIVQTSQIKEKQLEEPDEFHFNGTMAMSRIQGNGLNMDMDYYEEMDSNLSRRINRLAEWFTDSDENQKFIKEYGREVDVGKPYDLQKLFFEVLKYQPIKETKTGYAVDEEVLRKLNTPFTHKILQKRKLEKIKGTYLAQFIRETYNGKMHPFFDLHIPRTYRSSSSMPNFQNIPKRDSEAKRIVRGGIIPSPGNQFLEVDYGSQEVRIAACYSVDPVLMQYIENPDTDMHRDQAQYLFDLTIQEVTDALRFFSKNDFVFAQLYGSYYEACAKDLWEDCIEADLKLETGDPLIEHMFDRGIFRSEATAYEDFVDHVKKVEERFWEMLSRHNEWQEEVTKFYEKHGYVETFQKFRRGGYLKKNQIVNTPIQGTAYHCLQWTLVKLTGIAEKEKWESKICAQIHDSILIDLVPEEVEHILRTTKRVATAEIRERYDWIIVPLQLDAEMTRVDEPWGVIQKVNNNGYNKDGELLTYKEVNW